MGPFCLELCAGSGRLTAALRQVGLDAWGVDHKKSKLLPETAAMILLDLTDPSDVKILWRLLEHPLLIFVFMAPPCGTCSRSRERAVPGVLGGGPPPLRSDDFPEGFPDLAERLPDQFDRVTAANLIYKLLADVATYLLSRGIAWAIENPRNSILWNIAYMKVVISLPAVSLVTFQHCMYGGTRDKWTAIHFAPPGLFASLHRTCDKSHQHDPWGRSSHGVYATALETVYPQGLCEAIRACLLDGLRLQRAAPLPVRRARGDLPIIPPRDDRASAGTQPRGARSRRLIPEFKATIWLPGSFEPSDPRCKIGFIWGEGFVNDIAVPKDAKTIAVTSASPSSSPSSSSAGGGGFDGDTAAYAHARLPLRRRTGPP